MELKNGSTSKNQSMKTYHVSNMKDKSQMTISIGTEKAFNKTQHRFMIIMFTKLGIEGNCLSMLYMMKSPLLTYSKLKKIESFPSKIRTKARMPILPLLFNIVLEIIARAIRQEQ